jgi:non-heme Fe2+,alpha-ketoglutarate-dependent halogenase
MTVIPQVKIEAEQKQAETYFLTRDELAEFHTRGFLGPYDLMSAHEIKALCRKMRLELFDRTKAVYPDAQPGTGIYDYDRHLDNSILADVVCRPQIVHRMVSILGPDVLCWRTEFFPKYPGNEGTDWHQVDTFGGADGIPHIKWPNGSDFGGAMTAWIAFTDASADMSCMQLMPGTQHTMYFDESKGMHYDPKKANHHEINGVLRGFFGYDWREIQKDPDWTPDESQAITVPCRAGQFLIFPTTLMHASTPHAGKTKEMRLAVASRYVPTSVELYGNMKETNTVYELGGSYSLDNYGAVLVSGRNEYTHNRIRTHTTRDVPFVNCNPR